ncbi:uncharacterized protein [Leuresthes tenuis]|uniref:uncharacterized protein n=1 Tax=Leuresthes tenuis TaxID=355514 RepID=UPI003B503C6F
MDRKFDERLCKEVRGYPHLYNPSACFYKDQEKCKSSWREIAQTLGKEEWFCRNRWKALRDRFVRARKKLQDKDAQVDGNTSLPHIHSLLSWLSDFVKHRETEPNFLSAHLGDTSSERTASRPERDSHLPPSCLRLLVPPLRLMSACMWQIAQNRKVDQYGKLVDFITFVTETAPELLDYKQRTQLILGLRARLILEFLKWDREDSKAFQDHLKSFKETGTNRAHEEDQNEEVEISKSSFVELVQTLLRDQAEKETFFKEVFPAQYGACFDTALQILVWEILYQLEEFVPVPSFSQVFTMFDFASCDYELEQFLPHQEHLKRISQYQQQHQQKLPKSKNMFIQIHFYSCCSDSRLNDFHHFTNKRFCFSGEFTFTSDTILSTLASKQTLVWSGDHTDREKDPENGCSKAVSCDDDADSSSVSPNSREQDDGLSPLPCSPCSEDVGASSDGGTAGEAAFLPTRVTVKLDQTEEESAVQPSSGGTANVSDSIIENAERASEKPCQDFGKSSKSRLALTTRRGVDSSVRLFRCTECHLTYKYRRDLTRHFRMHFVPPLVCSHCNKSFNSKYLLKVHLLHHSGERPYACTYCDKRFLTKPVLKSHIRIHTDERPYECPVCNKKFRQASLRTVHIRMHLNDKPYLCSTCGMAFHSSGALLVHTRKHTGERPYQCDICKKRFVQSSQLVQHRRYHTGEKLYRCTYCDKSFFCSTGLKKHIRTHTGEKPFKCITCNKMFSQKANLKIHVKVHKNIRHTIA